MVCRHVRKDVRFVRCPCCERVWEKAVPYAKKARLLNERNVFVTESASWEEGERNDVRAGTIETRLS